ncbi:MAG TPA: TIGR04104 family putative zinc finger protein [Planococcus sp. (in: firmicutes)]|nr:TIGR04104 family putative zinc finger protein [Planococcus sp. (in: firmicutes)]
MPVCQNCREQWSWKQSIRNSFTLDHGLKCPNCERKQFLTKRARKRMILFALYPSLVMLLSLVFDISSILVLVALMAGGFLILLGIYPFLVELSNDEEALW